MRRQQDIPGLPFPATVDSVTTIRGQTVNEPIYFQLVPLQARHNLSDWLGLGAGLLLDVEYRRVESREVRVIARRARCPFRICINGKCSTLAARPAIFAEAQLGRMRQGPALGLRGLLPLEAGAAASFMAFAQWRF